MQLNQIWRWNMMKPWKLYGNMFWCGLPDSKFNGCLTEKRSMRTPPYWWEEHQQAGGLSISMLDSQMYSHACWLQQKQVCRLFFSGDLPLRLFGLRHVRRCESILSTCFFISLYTVGEWPYISTSYPDVATKRKARISWRPVPVVTGMPPNTREWQRDVLNLVPRKAPEWVMVIYSIIDHSQPHCFRFSWIELR